MIYRALFRHHYLRALRAPRPRLYWLGAALVGLLLVYVVVGLVAAGLAAEVLLYRFKPGVGIVGFVNSRLLDVALGLLLLRLFLQKTPVDRITPYLHLPVRRGVLARAFTLQHAISLHNALPLCFAVPFALRAVAAVGGTQGALLWLGGIVALLGASDLVTNGARALVGHHPSRFALLLAAVVGLFAADVFLGNRSLQIGVWLFFTTLARGNPMPLLGAAAVVVALFGLVTAYLTHRLRSQGSTAQVTRAGLRFDPRHPLVNLLRLEMALILRNARPRQFVLVSLLFSTAYLVVFLWRGSSGVGALLLGYMASGMFLLNYGPLMFAWESPFFDGLLARPFDAARLLRSKILLLQVSCGLLALAALPLYAWLAPDFVAHLGVATLYNAGVGTPMVVWLALDNRTRIDLDRSSMFNFQGVAVRHMAWTILLAVPPVALVLLWGSAGLMTTAAVGFLGAAVSLAWTGLFSPRFRRSRYAMAAAFRSSVA